MHKSGYSLKLFITCLSVLAIVLCSSSVFAFKARTDKNDIEAKEFEATGLYISSSQVPIAQVLTQLQNRQVWQNYLSQNKDVEVYMDPRSGRPVSLYTVIPIIPGTGVTNTITLDSLSKIVGYEVKALTADVVGDVVKQFLLKNAALLNINPAELAKHRVNDVGEYVWYVNFPRQVNGIPVRYSNITFATNHGNLNLWGTDKWSDVHISTIPTISKEQAIKIGFDYIGGQLASDKFTVNSHLEIIPVDPGWNGAVGTGYSHSLVWAYTFQREGYGNVWEVFVDAHQGKVISFLDTVQYVAKKIIGALYPVSDDECCPEGCAVQNVPALFQNTGLAAPNDYTNWGGIFDWTSGTVTTTLTGRYVHVTDVCGAINETSTVGDLDMRGTNADHNCTIPAGHSAGDTMASRSCGIEVTQMNRQVRSWITTMAWLDSFINCNVNQNNTCNANFSGNQINFFRSGGGCRNTGEIAAVFDHEWGHAVDTHDAQPTISQPGEAIADIAAAVRLHNSCIGRGFWWTNDRGCGQWTSCPTNPGPSYGYRCSGYAAASECCNACTGIREIDYAQHADPDADTIANYTCTLCTAGGGTPCGKETHCEGIPPAEVGWDLAARDLQAAPFSLDKQTAFTIADRIIWRGQNNVVQWYTCTCPSTASGCAATNAYPGWTLQDDNDGNTSNGTPHMTAIYAAFNRHGIACATPTPTNSGCTPVLTAPTLIGTPGNNSAVLSWTAVTGAATYNVWRTEGMGCDFGKAIIANVATTTYTDTQALNGRTYYYSIMAVGSNPACLGIISNCVAVTPVAGPACTAPTFGGVQSVADVAACTATGIRVNWNVPTSWGTGATGGTYDVRRYTTAGCSGGYTTVATGLAGATTTYVNTSATAGTTYYYQINAINNCTTPMSSVGTITCSSAIVDAVGTAPTGLTNNTAADLSACADTGVRITWTADPTNWGDGGSGTRTYNVLRGATTIATNLAYGITTFIDTGGTNGTAYTYTVRYNNGCALNATTTGASATDVVDTTPCASMGNILMVAKSGTNANITWTAVTCSDLANYRIYASATYSAIFPTAWTVIGNPVVLTQTDPLTSSYVGYKGVTIDACGNASAN